MVKKSLIGITASCVLALIPSPVRAWTDGDNAVRFKGSAIGIAFTNNYMTGRWADYAETSFGAALSWEYAFPVNLPFSMNIGMSLRASYQHVVPKSDSILDTCDDYMLGGGLWLRIPFSTLPLALQPEASYGVAARKASSAYHDIDGSHIQQAVSVAAGLRLVPAGNFEIELTPQYMFSLDNDEYAIKQYGIRAGLLYHFGGRADMSAAFHIKPMSKPVQPEPQRTDTAAAQADEASRIAAAAADTAAQSVSEAENALKAAAEYLQYENLPPEAELDELDAAVRRTAAAAEQASVNARTAADQAQLYAETVAQNVRYAYDNRTNSRIVASSLRSAINSQRAAETAAVRAQEYAGKASVAAGLAGTTGAHTFAEAAQNAARSARAAADMALLSLQSAPAVAAAARNGDAITEPGAKPAAVQEEPVSETLAVLPSAEAADTAAGPDVKSDVPDTAEAPSVMQADQAEAVVRGYANDAREYADQAQAHVNVALQEAETAERMAASVYKFGTTIEDDKKNVQLALEAAQRALDAQNAAFESLRQVTSVAASAQSVARQVPAASVIDAAKDARISQQVAFAVSSRAADTVYKAAWAARQAAWTVAARKK